MMDLIMTEIHPGVHVIGCKSCRTRSVAGSYFSAAAWAVSHARDIHGEIVEVPTVEMHAGVPDAATFETLMRGWTKNVKHHSKCARVHWPNSLLPCDCSRYESEPLDLDAIAGYLLNPPPSAVGAIIDKHRDQLFEESMRRGMGATSSDESEPPQLDTPDEGGEG